MLLCAKRHIGFERKMRYGNIHTIRHNDWWFADWCRKEVIPKKIVLWNQTGNANLPRGYKRPFDREDWNMAKELMDMQGWDVTEIDYRTPIREAFWHINTCECTVSYEGMWHYVAKKFKKHMIVSTKDIITKKFLQEKIEKATWFKESIAKRNDTLKNVFSAILNIQESYFISGNEKDLKPMKLADIAQVVNMDISTISRVSNSKYVATHFGTFKLKELFSEAYRKDNGELISTKEIKIKLQKIIETEDKINPLSDEKLAELLGENDYHIARRTVAKYRENLGIQTAKLRREL